MKQVFVLLPVLLVVVSSCSNGEFSCTSGECVPAGLVCDFKTNCTNGSDEEFCGCDFDRHSCGWNDISSSSYRWRRQMANVTVTPGVDHTTGSPSGYVMHIDGKDASFSAAKLEHSVDKLAALGCQVSFWYHIFENTSSSSPSSLKVMLVRGDAETDLLTISDINTRGWKNATAFIGNQPPGYKLRFSFKPLKARHVMLDDVKFENCAEGDFPAGSDQLSCNFESDICAWYHDLTASLLWKRGSDKLNENPAGDGYYMLITAASNSDRTSTARLISLPQAAGQVMCVSFLYHIFGNSIGSLKFISKRSGEPERVEWLRSGTQGNKWRFADLTFNITEPIQFIIEAVVGGTQGSIAIDNINIYSSETGACPAERECTFEGSLCGLLPETSANFSWSRITGQSQPANSSGPATDHTLRTEQGYYLSAQLWSRPVGSRGAVMTAVMEPTPADGECLMFWYYMEGHGVGELSVYIQTRGDNKRSVTLWSKNGDQGKHWRHGRVTLRSKTPYQVIFEAVVGDGPRRDVAIDDLTVLNGACPPSGFCDFEMDFCGWVNSPPAELGLEWDWLSGESDKKLIPERDHTTNSPVGHFAFFLPNEGEMAQLESETMEAVDRACLELWHNSNGWLDDKPSNINLTVFVNETAGLRSVWRTIGHINRTWIQERVNYNASGPHQIVLQARYSGSVDESFALDDVHIIRGRFCHDGIPITTPSPPTTTTSAPASAMDCTFENGLCSWVQEVGDDLNWTLSSGRQVDHPWDGPQHDHTVGNNQGRFLLLNGSGSRDGERAVISVPLIGFTSPVCVGFWYHMLGPSVSSLDLLVGLNSSEELIWTRRGTQNPEWIHAQVTVSNATRVMFTGHRNGNGEGFIAIDDITVREEACGNQNVCGFDSDSCDFENVVSHKGQWVRKRGTKSQVDHSYGTEHGFYMTVLSNSSQPEVAQLLTPELTAAERCVRFWYWLPAGSSNNLAVRLLRGNEPTDRLWQRSGAPSSGWEAAEVTVSSPARFRVVFEADHVPDAESAVRLDDVSVRGGACSPPGSCDFESGRCTWVNVPQEDGHDWVVASGGFQGPATDHTTQTPEGWFLLSSSRHQNHSSAARVLSEWIQPRDNASCVTLWYHMDSSDSGSLKVFKRSGQSEPDLMFNSQSSGLTWTSFSETVEGSKPFQLLIEAESNGTGFIAVDDISITPGTCQGNDASLGFVACSFDNDTCGWEDISVGQWQWKRGRNASENVGPSVDNTLSTELGWYMAVISDRGDQMSPAAVQSPTMKQASATCTLHFYYNMYGDDVEELTVALKDGARTTTLWWLSGGHEDLWHHGEVTVGRIPHDFTILFEASRAFTSPGHIAIDDIGFTNCSLPEPQPSCLWDAFTCNNSACVERSRVCDFSDDCGDGSDEKDCELLGVVERCSFENGLCSWANSGVDTPQAEWSRHKGQDGGREHGPPRDHTKNSAAGHYITPGTGQMSEILSTTLLPSSNCTVRFFFFGLDDAAATLTARSRTLQSGEDDIVLWHRDKSQSYSWQRAEVTFSSTANSKIVFRYERGAAPGGLTALDDISLSGECVIDPDNDKLPDSPPTSAPATSSIAPTSPASPSTPPTSPCQGDEFLCWRSAGKVCVQATLQCDYHPDCPQGEDEEDCGPCTFESNQCQWADTSAGQSRWQRQKASNNTEPPTDHTTDTGFFMRVNFSQGATQSEARLQSPSLPPSSRYCQILFHFHIRAESAGSLRVLMQQADGSEAILWSRSHNTVSHWASESLPLGAHQQPYTVWFSSINKAAGDHIVAVDDISFLNCEDSYRPPALSACGCTFEDGQCVWLQGAEDALDWLSRSGPTETPNTGPAGDHTTGKGKYLYIESSAPSVKGSVAQLKSPLLPPAGENGYCFSFWHHMFGATVGSLRMLLQTADPWKKTTVWQKSGNQGDEWQLVQIHVTLQKVHQVILEATVGGEAGDIGIDDITFVSGPCPASDVCDFEEGSCNWQQEVTDVFDWVRHSGPGLNPDTGPDSDHTTNTPAGHYYYLCSSDGDRPGETAEMFSPLYPAAKGACVQLWYHMYGKKMGVLNVYQQSEEGKRDLIFSQRGDQGRLWRFAQASLLPRVQPYRIVVEGVKYGRVVEEDMAFDDFQITDSECPPPGHCDFQNNMCSWSNVGGGVDEADWLRGRGASPNPNTGPSVDHTTNSPHGYYLYVDSSVGHSEDRSFLISEVFQPSTRGHCLTFWYHMYGRHVGSLRVYLNNRKMHDGGNEEGILYWTVDGNKGDKWHKATVPIKHQEAFWFVFVYQRWMKSGGDTALDDITVLPDDCYLEPPIQPPDDDHDGLSVGLAVGLTLLAGVIISVFLFMLNRKHRTRDQQTQLITNDAVGQDPVFCLFDCKIDETQHGTETDFSFFNNLYAPSHQESTTASTEASYEAL